MKLTKKEKKQIKGYIARMYYFLDNHADKIIFKKIKKDQGYHVSGKDGSWWIEIDYTQQLLPTLWHECLHQWHRDWKHSDIYKMEKFIMNRISPTQVRNILKKLGQCL